MFVGQIMLQFNKMKEMGFIFSNSLSLTYLILCYLLLLLLQAKCI